MTVRINFKNTNSEAHKLYLYRSTERFSEESLPQPIAELPGNARSYDDSSFLLYDTDYYYAFIVEGPTGEKSPLMPLRKVRLSHDVGPGSGDIVSGNETLGYMGMVTVGDDGYGELWSLLPADVSAMNERLSFIKYIRNGIISYTLTGTVSIGRTDTYYRKGYFFGGSAINSLAGSENMRKIIEDDNKVKFTRNARVYSLHIPVMLKEGDSTSTLPTLTPGGTHSVSELPVGVCEAVDFWRMFGNQATPSTDITKVPMHHRLVQTGNGIVCSGTGNSNASHYCGILQTTNMYSSPTFSKDRYVLNSSNAYALNFVIEYEGLVN